jgi:hypothetical protein
MQREGHEVDERRGRLQLDAVEIAVTSEIALPKMMPDAQPICDCLERHMNVPGGFRLGMAVRFECPQQTLESGLRHGGELLRGSPAPAKSWPSRQRTRGRENGGKPQAKERWNDGDRVGSERHDRVDGISRAIEEDLFRDRERAKSQSCRRPRRRA